MGVSTCIVGFQPPDEQWQKMKDAYDACEKAGVEIPRTILDFFNWDPPDDAGVRIDLEKHESVSVFQVGGSEGFQVDIGKLPKHVKFVRFYNSW